MANSTATESRMWLVFFLRCIIKERSESTDFPAMLSHDKVELICKMKPFRILFGSLL